MENIMIYFFIIVFLGFIFLIAWLIGNIIDTYKKVIGKLINIEKKVMTIETILKEYNDSDNNKP